MKKVFLFITVLLASVTYAKAPLFVEADSGASPQSNLFFWHRYKSDFESEVVFVRFPYAPTVSQGGNLCMAYSYDYNVLYSLSGYNPPIGDINHHLLFERTIADANQPPNVLHSSKVYQSTNGDWIHDYVILETHKNVTIQARTIVTPFNAYTLQCVSPSGTKDHFDYFLESFYILYKCVVE